MRRAALIYNPTAGRQRHARVLDAVLANLRQGGFDVEPVLTGGPGQATRLAREQAEGRAEAVLAFGGDGTVREGAAGLLGTDATLGILPGGTVNVLARSLGLPRDPVAAARLLGRLKVQKLDVGLVGKTLTPPAPLSHLPDPLPGRGGSCLAGGRGRPSPGEGARGGGRGDGGEGSPFLMMVSAGLDSTVLAALDTRLKWRFGRTAYLYQGLQEWWRYPYPRLAGTADGEPFDASFVAVCNIPYYGGAFALAPGARPHDGRLDLVLFRGGGRSATVRFALDLLRGAHARRRDVAVRHVREVVLQSPPGAAAQIDGDLCEERLPVTVRIASDPLCVLAPEIPPA
jgi:diacylglycerol kinase (ATP)